MVEELWDLRAVVEGCSRSRTMSGSFSSASLPPEEPEKMEYPLFSVKDEAGPQELQEFVKHYLQPSKEQNNNEEKKTLSPAAKSKKKRFALIFFSLLSILLSLEPVIPSAERTS